LINVYDQIIRNWLRCPKDTTITNPPGPGSLTFHWSIMEALEARDVDALKNTMESHIEHVKQKIVLEISQRTGS
jgi:DNA-binding FadR family transcriptional regulator